MLHSSYKRKGIICQSFAQNFALESALLCRMESFINGKNSTYIILIAGLKFKDVKKEVTLFAFINILQFFSTEKLE